EEGEKAPQRKREEEERNAQPRGVGEEQRGALPDRAVTAREREDGAQDGSHARRPANGEGEAHREGPDEAGRLLLDLELGRAPEEAHPEYPRHVEPEDDDEDPARDADPVAIVEKELARGAPRHPEAPKNPGEPPT